VPKGPSPRIKNIGASIRARLLNLAKERHQPFQLILNYFVLERLLYRLSQTKHRHRFILKGAILLTTWLKDSLRPTKDLDFLAVGNPDQQEMVSTFQEICAVPLNDGVVFDATSVRAERIREQTEYGGLRIMANATVDQAKVRVLIDVAFGDAIEPGLQEIEMPTMLDFPAPRLHAYGPETVIAEKFQTMVMLGRANSRMKDFYDIWLLSRTFEFKDDARDLRNLCPA
jgi:predicted nucleotidyltransferase component of viral defense system